MAATWITRRCDGPKRVNHAAVIISNRMFVIGGYYNGLRLVLEDPIDTFVFTLNDLKWDHFPVDTTEAPFMRYGHSLVVYEGNIYLFGGRNDILSCHDLFKLDVAARKWSQVKTTGRRPFPRDGHTACLIGSVMYIYGGFLDEPINRFATGLNFIDLKTMTWDVIETTTRRSKEPECRDFHQAVAVGTKMYLFGGRSSRTPPFHTAHAYYPNTLHVFDSIKRKWSIIKANEKTPQGRRSLSMFVHGTDIYVFGGYNSALHQHFNDLHKFDTVTEEWSQVYTHGPAPCARRRQTCVCSGRYVFLYGGTSPQIIFGNLSIDESDEEDLTDHCDLHILDLYPTLKTLCIMAVIKYQLRTQCLPKHLAAEVRLLTPSFATAAGPTTARL